MKGEFFFFNDTLPQIFLMQTCTFNIYHLPHHIRSIQEALRRNGLQLSPVSFDIYTFFLSTKQSLPPFPSHLAFLDVFSLNLAMFIHIHLHNLHSVLSSEGYPSNKFPGTLHRKWSMSWHFDTCISMLCVLSLSLWPVSVFVYGIVLSPYFLNGDCMWLVC